MLNNKRAYLLLENGSLFEADLFGYDEFDDLCAEIVFNTSMVGYTQTLTDPSYYGQMIVQTFPLIGNYGVNPLDFENEKSYVRAYIAREFCKEPSNFRSRYSIEKFLIDNKIPALCNIDTRALTKQLRTCGTMNAIILKSFDENDKDKILKELKNYKITNAIAKVSTKESIFLCSMRPYRIVIMDFGCKKSDVYEFIGEDFDVIIVPYDTTAQKIKQLNPDGVLLSDGPGDPMKNTEVISEIKKLSQMNMLILGVGMGHQLLALANGAKTKKLKYGHRGSSQPVKDVNSGKVYITAQNHGYVVDRDSLSDNMHMRFVNINDNTCEGIEYTDIPALSIQFNLKLCAGAQDSNLLLDEFISMVKERKTNASK